MLKLALACVIAFLISLFGTPLVRKLAFAVGAVDVPNERKVHKGAMPRLGGLAMFAAFLVGVLIFGDFSRPVLGLIIGGALIVAIGIVDDIRGVTPKQKLLVQLIAAIVFVYCGGYVKYITNPIAGNVIFLDYWGIPLTLLWLVGISNAINLIDGLDGLAGGVSAISAFTMAVVSFTTGYLTPSALALILVFAIMGFLKHNFSPASIFMGDSGSLFLGFTLGAMAIMGFSKGATIISLVIPILILGVPIFDTFFAIVRRKRDNKPIFQADKGHLHHRLLAMGLSHKQTVVIIYAITLFMGVCAIALTMLTSAQAVLILIIVSVILIFGANRLGVLKSKRSHKQENLSEQANNTEQTDTVVSAEISTENDDKTE